MWYIRNVFADLVNLIWFDLLHQPERVKTIFRHFHAPNVACNSSCGVGPEDLLSKRLKNV